MGFHRGETPSWINHTYMKYKLPFIHLGLYRVLYVANEGQTLSEAFSFVVCICLIWLCKCTKYHWNLYAWRTQRANSTYVDTSCCIYLCILSNLIIVKFLEEDVYRLRTQRARSGSLNYVCWICLFVCSSIQFLFPWKRSLQTMDAKCLITCELYSLFIMYDVLDDSIIIYWSTLLLQNVSPSR